LASKTEKFTFHHPGDSSEVDTLRLGVFENLGNPVGFIDFAMELKYLGSIVHHSLTSDADVDKHIRSASAAFGALKNILNFKQINFKVQRII
jgi:hypothetical protein